MDNTKFETTLKRLIVMEEKRCSRERVVTMLTISEKIIEYDLTHNTFAKTGGESMNENRAFGSKL